MKRCDLCPAPAQFRDRGTGQYLCLAHARLEVVSSQRALPDASGKAALTIRPATPADAGAIQALALHFWGETVVDCFDRQVDVAACPAFVACDGEAVVGLAAYALERREGAAVLVMLNVLPGWQGRGGGQALLETLCAEAARQGLGRVRVVTSNDDLPALGFYQRRGFRITGVLPGRIAEHHGGEEAGFWGLPVRDEVRLERVLGPARDLDEGAGPGN